jgi:hypothetical protein
MNDELRAGLLERAGRGDASPRDLAYLKDRVLHENRARLLARDDLG